MFRLLTLTAILFFSSSMYDRARSRYGRLMKNRGTVLKIHDIRPIKVAILGHLSPPTRTFRATTNRLSFPSIEGKTADKHYGQ